MIISETTHYVSALARTSIFYGTSREDLHALLCLSQPRVGHAQQALCWQGEPCGEFYFLIDGLVKAQRINAANKLQTLNIIHSGEVFGIEALFSGDGYLATFNVERESKLLVFQASQFLHFIRTRPVMVMQILATLSKSIGRLVKEIDQLKLLNAEQRIAAYLLENYDQDSGDNKVVLPAKRSDLASMLAITPETLCREVKKLKQTGCVSGYNGFLYIDQPSRLEEIISGGTVPPSTLGNTQRN